MAVEVLSGILILIGLVGSVLPLIPGPPISFIGLFIYAYSNGPLEVATKHLIVFGVLTVLSLLLDYFAPTLGAKYQKASKYGVFGALIGSFAGLFTAGVIGLFVGPLIGGFLGEYLYKRDLKQAVKSAWGTFVGAIVGTVFRVLVSISILIYFLIVLFY